MTETLVKKIPAVPEKNGSNKVHALVFEVPVAKLDSGPSGSSRQLPEDEFAQLVAEKKVLAPPFDLFLLTTLWEYNTELEPCLSVMATNIDGFGYRLLPRVQPEKADDETRKKIIAERLRLKNFFLYAGMKSSFRQIRGMMRRDLEATGNAYWEVVRNPTTGVIQYFAPIRSYQVRISAQDAEWVGVDFPAIEHVSENEVKVAKFATRIRFRRYVQLSTFMSTSSMVTGTKKVWFKEFGDPRVIDNTNGKVVPDEEVKNWNGTGAPMPYERRATEAIHFSINSTRSPYGMPRFIGVMLDMFGDRKASEINYTTFCNNNVPSLLIAVSNGQLTEESVNRIKELMEKLQGNDNRATALVLEAESKDDDGGEDSGHCRIDVKPLTREQISDAQFSVYAKDNRDKVRVSFRLPPIFLGRTEDYTRTTAETSRRLADEQVFAPARDDFDDFVNLQLFPVMGVIYHVFKSNSPNTTDNEELVKILAGAEKTGGMTPRIARRVLEDILGTELPDFPEEFNPDLPFSLAMAEAVKNQADPTEPGQQLTALKRLDLITRLLDQETGGGDIVTGLLDLRKRLEDQWQTELFASDDDGE
jgi:PBSX family phage portal protein